MKRCTAACAFLLITLLLPGCASAVKKTPLYLYAVGIDADDETVYLSALCCEGTSQGNTGEDGSGEGTGTKEGHALTRYHFGGRSVDEAFETMRDTCQELYAGTLAVYVVAESLPRERLCELGVYLLNAPSLPLSASACEAKDADEQLAYFEAAYTDKEIAEALEGRGENVIAYLTRRCGVED